MEIRPASPAVPLPSISRPSATGGGAIADSFTLASAPLTVAVTALFPPPPAHVPPALWKALGKDTETARAHWKEIEALPCAADQKDRIAAAYPVAVENGRGNGLLDALAIVADQPEAGALFERYAKACKGLAAKTARADLTLALTEAARRGASPVGTYDEVAAVRALDPNLKNDGYSSARIDAAVAFVLDAATPALQTERRDALGLFAAHLGFEQALDLVRPLAFLKATGAEREAVLSLYRDLVKSCNSRALSPFTLPIAAVDVPGEVASRVADFRMLHAATNRVDLAVADMELASRASNGCSRTEAAAMLARIRTSDPAHADRYGQYADPTAAFDYVLHGPIDTPAGRLDSLLSLHVGGRNASEALVVEQRIAAASCDGVQRAALRVLVGKCMKMLRAKCDPFLADIVGYIDGPDAPARFALAQSLLDVTKNVARAAADMKSCLDISAARGVSLDECVGHMKALLASDPAVKDGYVNQTASASGALDEIASGATPEARAATRADLLGLYAGGRNAEHAVVLLRAVRATGTGADATADIHKRLTGQAEKFNSKHDSAFVDALAEATATGDPVGGFAAFCNFLALVKQPAVALGDLQAVRALSERRAIDLGIVSETVQTLRKADSVGNEPYGAWCSLGATLDTLLPAGTSADGARLDTSRLAAMQVNGRDSLKALALEQALRALPCADDERTSARATILPLLQRFSVARDGLLLDVLAQALRSGAPRLALQAFGRLFEVSGRLEMADADLGLVVDLAASGHALDETAERLVALRTDDPARKNPYDRFQEARAALVWTMGGSASADRAERSRLLQAHQRAGRPLDEAVAVERRIGALQTSPAEREAVREAWFTVLAVSDDSRRDGAERIKVFDAVDGQPDAAARVKVFGALVAVAGSPAQALSDLDLVVDVATRKGLPLDEVAALASDIRRADMRAGSGQPADLGDAVGVVAEGADATDRAARAASLAQLFEATGRAPAAVHRLQTILAAPLADGGLEDATRKMMRLSRLEGSASEIDGVYAHLQSRAATEHFSWLRKALQQTRPYERVVWEVTGLSRNASTVLGILEGLERAALPGESPRVALKRFRSVLEADADYGPGLLDVSTAQRAFGTSLQGLPWSNEGLEERWKRFLGLASELRNTNALALVWSASTSADNEAEYQARRAAFGRLGAACGSSSRGTAGLYAALTERLRPSDSIEAALPEMLALIKQQGPRLAAETWRIARDSDTLSAPELAAQKEVLGHACTGDDLRTLWDSLRTPVGTETLLQRADALKQALGGGLPPNEAVKQLRSMASDLGADIESCLSAYAGLVAVLRARTSTPLPVAADLLSHARHLREEGSRLAAGIEPTPLADMLLGLTQSLLMGSDAERAKSQLRTVEEQRRQAPMYEGKGGRIDMAEAEINIGGIRIPRRA